MQHLRDDDEIYTTHNITFPFPYAQAPQVLLWLKRIDLMQWTGRSLQPLVVDITTLGFTLEVCRKPSLKISELDISWLACSVGRVGVAIGTFQINSRARCEENVAFQRGLFKTPPRVVVGITGFQINICSGLALSVRVVEVTSEGMKWRIDGGEDKNQIATAMGSFIAME